MFAEMMMSASGGGTLKDIIRDKAFNGGYTEICTFTPYSNRCTINEAKAVADTVNHKVYVYIDMVNLFNYTTEAGWVQIVNINNLSNKYLPIYASSSRDNAVPLITDDSSDNPLLQWVFGYSTSGYGMRVYTGYGQKFNSGERYIVYAAYSYK